MHTLEPMGKIVRATSNSNETGLRPRPSASGGEKLHRLLSQRKLSQIPTSKGRGESKDGTLPTAKMPEGVGVMLLCLHPSVGPPSVGAWWQAGVAGR